MSFLYLNEDSPKTLVTFFVLRHTKHRLKFDRKILLKEYDYKYRLYSSIVDIYIPKILSHGSLQIKYLRLKLLVS